MTIQLFLSLLAVCVIPLCIVLGMPNKETFFNKPIVRGFGLGVYAALVFLLLHEAIEHAGPTSAVIWGGAGLGISILIGICFKEFHHHHAPGETHEHHTKASMWRILTSDFFHNIVDGIAIVSGFAISPVIGFTSFIGILLHQTIQQAGQQILLVESGLKTRKAILVSLFVSLSIFLGVFLEQYESIEAPLIALSAGIILWKIGTDILHTKWSNKTVFGFFVGTVILTISLLLIPHAH